MRRQKKHPTRFLFPALSILCGAAFWGCQSARPLSPDHLVSLSFSVPLSNEVRAALLGAASNEILYKVEGGGAVAVEGGTGAFSTASISGSVLFTASVPALSGEVLSLQLNDAATHQALALGAARLDFGGSSPATVSVNLGSLIRDCSTTNLPLSTGGTYGFAADALLSGQITSGAGWDVAFSPAGSTYDMLDAQTGFNASIAYMGNGNLVDFDYVPADSSFSSDSYSSKYNLLVPPTPSHGGGSTPGSVINGKALTPGNYYLDVGDVYCLKLGSMAGHAWVQVTSLGTQIVTGGITGPSFCFRVNSSLPYYAYEQSPADQNGAGPCNTNPY